MTRSPRLFSLLAGFGTLVLVIGCGKSDQAPEAGGPAAAGSGNPTFDQNCAKCHNVKGGPRRSGPDLSKVGADPAHTPDWIAQYVANPKAQKPAAKMPAFGEKLSPGEIKGVAEFLAGMKG